MRLPRPPDWLIFLGVVAVLGLGAIAWRQHDDAKSIAATPMSAGWPLGPATPFDPAIVVKVPVAPGEGAGTAFSIGDGGIWLTARHVVDGCARVAIVTAPGRGVAAIVRLAPGGGETAVLLTKGGAPALPLSLHPWLRRGALAYEPGFPHAEPGEAASRLISRVRLVLRRGRDTRTEPVLAWSEIERIPSVRGSLVGLSGAPVLDGEGRVIGVTVAQSPKRGRFFTTTPSSLRAALRAAGVSPESGAVGGAITPSNFGQVSDGLRRGLRVAEVVCLAS